MKRIILITAMIFVASLGYTATLQRTSSNTIVFTDDYSTTEYIDPTGVNTYITTSGSGMVRNASLNTSCWDGPTVDLSIDQSGNIYAIVEATAHSDMVTATPPFGGTSGNYRPDLYVMKFNTSGTKMWTEMVQLRSEPDSYVTFDGSANESKNPNSAIDPATGDLYVTWNTRISNGQWRVKLQKVAADGSKPWGTEINVFNSISYYGAGVTVLGSYVYVVYGSGGNVYICKYDKSTGALSAGPTQVNAAAHANSYHPKIVAGPDGYLYVVWMHTGGINIYGQRLDTSLARVNWGGSATDKLINRGSGYSYGSFWYGWTEDEVNIDMRVVGGSTNLYVVWAATYSGAFNTFAQMVACNGGGYTQSWGDATHDLCVSESGNLNGDVYPDITVSDSYAYVSYITHETAENDRMMIQRLDPTTGVKAPSWESDPLYTGLGHHGRIASLNNYLYVTSVNIRLRKFDFNKTQLFDVYYLDRYYVTRSYYSTYSVMPGTVLQAVMRLQNTLYQTGAFYKFWVTPDGGTTVYGPQSITNSTGSRTFDISTLGNDFRFYCVMDNDASNSKNYTAIRQVAVEATKIYLGDALVGKAPDGSDASGDLVLNTTGVDQALSVYVYNNGVNSASAYFFIKNNGNISSNFYVSANAGNANWDVSYWLCDSAGQTNKNITAAVTGSGYSVTNLLPYQTDEWIIVKAFATPSVSLSQGDSYTLTMNVYAQTGPVTFVQHDTAKINAVISFALPDLIVDGKTAGIGYGIQDAGGAGEVAYQIADTNVTRTFFVHLRNAGGSDAIHLSADAGDANWSVSYWTNGVDVTAQITGAGMSNYILSDGVLSNIEVRVKPNTTAVLNSTNTLHVHAYSYQDGSKVDDVIVRTIRVNTRPDLYIDGRGYGIYSLSASSQTSTNYSDNGFTNNFTVVLSNSGSYKMDFQLSAVMSNTLNTGWRVFVYDGTSNITKTLTNSIYTLSNLARGATHTFTVRIITPATVNAGANEVMGVYLTAKGEGDTANNGKWDVCGARHKTISSWPDLALDGTGYGVFESINPTIQTAFKYIRGNTNFAITLTNRALSAYNVLAYIPDYLNQGYVVRYTNGSSDITSALSGAGWTASLPALGSTTITAYVVTNTAAIGATNNATIRIYSTINNSDADSVKYTVSKAVPPDMQVRFSSEANYHGDNVYSTDPVSVGQVSPASYPQSGFPWYRFLIKSENDLLAQETSRFTATLSTGEWVVKFFKYIGATKSNPDLLNPSDWSEVTASITNQAVGADNVNVASGDYVVYKVEVQALSATNEGDQISIDVTGRGLNTQFRDTVRVILTYGMGLPDIVYGGQWDDFYATDYSQVVATNFADKAKGSVYDFVIQNDSLSNPSAFFVTGNAISGNWNLIYTNRFAAGNIHPDVVGSGYLVYVSNQSSITLSVKLNAAGSTLPLGTVTNVNIRVFTQGDELDDYLKIVTILTDYGRPDVVLGNNGDNYYNSVNGNTTGTNIYIGWGDSITVPVVVQNDRSIAENIKIYGSDAPAQWTIRYLTNTADVSASVKSGFSISSLNPYIGGFNVLIPANTTLTLNTVVSLATNSTKAPGIVEDFYIYTYSEGRLISDKARIHATVWDGGRPDIVALADVSEWSNVYESAPVNQIVSTNTEKSWLNRTLYLLQNDRSRSETLKFRATGGTGDWNLDYLFYDAGAAAWSNISAAATNGYQPLTIPANSCVTLAVEGFLPAGATNLLGTKFTTKLQLMSSMSFVTDSGNVELVVADMTVPDLQFTNGQWGNAYYTVYIPSSISNSIIEKGQTNYYYLYLQNDSSTRSNTFYLYGTEQTGDWIVDYYKYVSGSPVLSTYAATHSNLNVTLLPSSNQLIQVRATIKPTATMGTNNVINLNLVMASSFGGHSDIGRIALKYVDLGLPDLVYGNGFGDGDRENPASDQITNVPLEYGANHSTVVIAQNDRTDRPETLRFMGGYPDHADFTLKYYSLDGATTNDITTAVTNFTYMPTLGMNSSVTLMLTMSLKSNSTFALGVTKTIPLQLISFGQACTDSVQLNYFIADLAKPNIYLTNNLFWSNTIESNGTYAVYQVTNIGVEQGHTNLLYYYIQNNRSGGEEFDYRETPTYSGANAYWQYRYSYYTGSAWSNITASVTNGWTRLFSGSERVLMRAEVYVPYDNGQPFTNRIDDKLHMQAGLRSWMGFIYDRARFSYVLSDPGMPNIEKTNGQWTIVDSNPTSQKQDLDIEKGYTNTYTLVLLNERSTFDRFILSANAIEWNSLFYLTNKDGGGWTNVTGGITNGMILSFDPHETNYLRIVAYAGYDDTNAQLTAKDIQLELKTLKDKRIDRIELNYVLVDNSTPDIVAGGRFDNEYYFNSEVQVTNIGIEKGQTVSFPIAFQNDYQRTYNYVIAGSGVNPEWGVVYQLSNAGSLIDYTAQITNTGITNIMTNYQSIDGIFTMGLASNSGLHTNQVMTNQVRMFSLAQLRIEQVGLAFRVTDRGDPRVYLASGLQLTNLLMKRGDSNSFQLVLSNARTDTTFADEDLLVKLTPSFSEGWSFTVSAAGADISAGATNGGFVLLVPNGAATNLALRIDMSVSNTNHSGLTNFIRMQAYSHGREVISETVFEVIKQEPTPDLSAISLSGSGAVGDNVYNNPTNQAITGFVIATSPATYSIILENDDVIVDSIMIRAEGDINQTNRWEVTIEDDDLGLDLTSSIQSNTLYRVERGSSKMFILKVKALPGVSMNETNTIRFVAFSTNNTNKYDVVTVNTIRIPVTTYGYVRNYSGQMLDQATVSFYSMFSSDLVQAETETNGYYSLLVVPGTYRILVQRHGYVDVSDVVTVKEVSTFSNDTYVMLPVNLDETQFDAHSFPNPVSANAEMTLLINQPTPGLLKAQLFDVQGRLIKTFFDEEKEAGVYTVEWDSRGDDGAYLLPGVYLLFIYNGTETKIRKIFVQ